MQRIPRRSAVHYLLRSDIIPAIQVDQQERFVVETEDAFSGRIQSENDLPTREVLSPGPPCEPELSNPLAGPVFVRNAKRGDLMAVHIHSVIPVGHGATLIKQGQGALWDSHTWSRIHQAPLTRVIEHSPGPSGTLRDGQAHFGDRISWKLAAFIGTIGVAPSVEVETSIVGQGVWGGNWDCRDIKESSILYLNCYHPGGLLYLGDVHGSQGDGELSGTANEVRADVTLSCEVIGNTRIPYPRVETPDALIALFADKPLEEAIEKALASLLEWLVSDYQMDPREAYMLLSVHPNVRINIYQMVPLGALRYTVGVQFPKSCLE